MKNKEKIGISIIEKLCIVGVILFLIISIWFCFFAIHKMDARDIVENGEIKVATYTSTYATGGGTIGVSRHSYYAKYYYKDIDGTEYTGLSPSSYETREEAEKLIGSTIAIKIDGNGNSVRLDYAGKPATDFWIISSVSMFIVLVLIVLIILEEVKRRKRTFTYRELFKRDSKNEKEE